MRVPPRLGLSGVATQRCAGMRTLQTIVDACKSFSHDTDVGTIQNNVGLRSPRLGGNPVLFLSRKLTISYSKLAFIRLLRQGERMYAVKSKMSNRSFSTNSEGERIEETQGTVVITSFPKSSASRLVADSYSI